MWHICTSGKMEESLRAGSEDVWKELIRWKETVCFCKGKASHSNLSAVKGTSTYGQGMCLIPLSRSQAISYLPESSLLFFVTIELLHSYQIAKAEIRATSLQLTGSCLLSFQKGCLRPSCSLKPRLKQAVVYGLVCRVKTRCASFPSALGGMLSSSGHPQLVLEGLSEA